LTSGGGATSVNQSIAGLNLNVIAGERIHMHSNAATGVGGALSCYIYVEDGSGGKRGLVGFDNSVFNPSRARA